MNNQELSQHHHAAHAPNWAARMEHLNDVGRLTSQVSEADLARLLALLGNEDVLDLGSGTGFYTDRIAPLTTGTWHEIGGRLDVSGLATMLRPNERLIVIDWGKDPDSWDFGPPEDVRYSADEVTAHRPPHHPVRRTAV
jgi:hypothetical protein